MSKKVKVRIASLLIAISILINFITPLNVKALGDFGISSPIISTALDITGIAVYFIITTALLSKIV